MAGAREIRKGQAKQAAEQRRQESLAATRATRARVDADNAQVAAAQPQRALGVSGADKLAQARTQVATPTPGTQQPNQEADKLEGVQFASAAAHAAAADAGLVAEDFKRKRKSSEQGYTKADVERIAGNREATEEE